MEFDRLLVAQAYMKNAYYLYTTWGTTEKIKQLQEVYPQLLPFDLAEDQSPLKSMSVSVARRSSLKGTNASETLDLSTVIKASQTISSEIVLADLLTKMISIVIENAGAERGWLILEKEGHWYIEAEGDINSKDVRVLQSLPID